MMPLRNAWVFLTESDIEIPHLTRYTGARGQSTGVVYSPILYLLHPVNKIDGAASEFLHIQR
ncbi:hypothetical protein NEUTE1DRAFT_116555 [Neurospora tetrasperma FGSC 2508]|uniref:Uncharacterized protein n=1 Tax=Neurospora tetrasperma (strain FGSC 2508 / ATCC MYA-4615 / P0657) TaxID=510951 RepID=F8MH28_NEUT8|nr:uncharacterized protein NEUTE1DRAFT_116555 [Neurospora tetrasperma FGSC 2508]EGO59544.1 hypothetical protein NEUTE1DRAFT_116555 [Neurospora tetrasperma FGSC 2508]EGZ73676.1 hypothetical protein NEUTE2DRAFT_87127 [Neurospora tetrasperma FGSC 2509]